ncbi:metal-dependent hydrolase family protein [Alicyclobacillus macrosporangiidus]|uniref:Imidazolonepropionase n=1 Tax=Alicyclobacillus macrosporangiidus TaxID=392015 RepID=A0A1I7LDN5_9BACL|nr:amidohydrolase family protein [Alicyclobacillus macrosporangiidus]SFV07805.1 Imidazolonepropionase [Alicyclobacillus macrosporangiidus]
MAFKLIRNGTLIDGRGGDPVESASVLIDGNKIVAVGPEAHVHVPADAEVFDAQGGCILPGFIDTHVHIMFQVENFQKRLTTPFAYNFYKALTYMRNTLNAGITSIRDAGGADVGLKMAVEDGLVEGPRMQVSIEPLTITGGHGDSWMLSGLDMNLRGYPGHPSGVCDGVEEVRKKVREILRAGADVIKVHATGGVLSPTDHPEFTQFSLEELKVMVQEGQYRRGVKVMAHAQGAEGIRNAVLAGIHSIEHGVFIDDETAELMVQHGTYLVPTLLAPVSVLEAAERDDSMPEYGIRKCREVIECHKESVARAYKAGVKIAMGTDAGVMPHGTNLRELGLMCEIGMSPMEAIVATTKVAAECMGWEDKVGTVEVGKLADVIITRTNPLKDIRSLENTNNVVTVFKDGKVVKDIREGVRR